MFMGHKSHFFKNSKNLFCRLFFAEEQVTFTVALALGINPILDMFETACNVTGDNICTYIVSKKIK